MKQRCTRISLALAGGLGLALLLTGLVTPAHADPGDRYVAVGGVDTTNDCTDSSTPCRTVQHAVDAADPGDAVLVAQGTYTGTSGRPAPSGYVGPSIVTQMVYISKTVTIRGGYTTTDHFATSFPLTRPTTLDAQGQGRVLFITGAGITPTIEGLHITGGDAGGLGGLSYWETHNAGGGVYIIAAQATLNNNVIFNNTTPPGVTYGGWGGGVFLMSSAATLSGNTITANTASGSSSNGGGVCLRLSDAATLSGNAITANTAWFGGGVYLTDSAATLSGNTIAGNVASDYNGGGVYVSSSQATLNGNRIISNTAHYYGGGVMLMFGDPVLTNNLVADNHLTASATAGGSGVAVHRSNAQLLHTTVVRNTGNAGVGVYVERDSYYSSNAVLTNTIVASQAVGVYVDSGSATLSHVLWGSGAWANGTNADDNSGNGTITVTHAITGDPDFVNPSVGDYHIGSDSAAVNNGVDAGTTDDIDGDPRPGGGGVDIGCDETTTDLIIRKAVTPTTAIDPGDRITYTLAFSHAGTGGIAMNVVITDLVPISVTSRSVVSSGITITDTGHSPDFVWRIQDLGAGDSGVITITGIASVPLAVGTFTNIATIATTTENATLANNSDAARVTVRNLAPVLGSDATHTITENVNLGTFVGSPMTGTDANGDALSYTITDGNIGGAFAINNSGQVTVAGSIDYETTPQYVLTVQASDGELTDTATVTVTVLNVDDEPALSVEKTIKAASGTTVVPPGEVVTYTILLKNSSTSDLAANVVMTDPLPSGVTFRAWVRQDGGAVVVPLQTVGWGPTDIAANTAYTISFTADVTSSAAFAAESIPNTAYIVADNASPDPHTATFTVKGVHIYLPLVMRNF